MGLVAAMAVPVGAAGLNDHERDMFNGNEVASDGELDAQRGRERIDFLHINAQEMIAVVDGNSAINTSTGVNAINHDAFSNGSGFVSVIQNSGNNVLIQEATIISITIER